MPRKQLVVQCSNSITTGLPAIGCVARRTSKPTTTAPNSCRAMHKALRHRAYRYRRAAQIEFSKSHFAKLSPVGAGDTARHGSLTKWRMKMSETITLALRAEDAEPILRKEAYDAAKYGSLLDYVPRKCWNHPKGYGMTHDQQQAMWRERFLRAKRIVESFGIEYEPVSEAETISHRYKEITRVKRAGSLAGIGFQEIEHVGYDTKKMEAHYVSGYHSEACKAAADRAVRSWKANLTMKQAA